MKAPCIYKSFTKRYYFLVTSNLGTDNCLLAKRKKRTILRERERDCVGNANETK
jgi:hypothetical protein